MFLENLYHKIVSGVVAVAIAIGSLFAPAQIIETVQEPAVESVGTTIPTVVALFSTSLSAGITSSATSFTLNSGTDKAGNSLSGTYGFVIDEGTSDEEFVVASCTATACTSALRGISVVTGDDEITALKKAHRRGASVKMSDHPQLAIVSRLLNGDETLPNIISYTSDGLSFTSNTQIVNKKYVDDTNNSGAADASTTTKGLVEQATTAEINAGTATGATGAVLITDPSTLLASNYGLYLPSSGQKDALVGTSTPSGSNLFVNQNSLLVSDLQVFTSTGTNIWTKPTGYPTDSMVLVQMWGAGGGGGGTNVAGGAGGGGGGAYNEVRYRLSDLTSTVNVYVGLGGIGGTATVGGTTGGLSAFGSYAYAYGGGGGSRNNSLTNEGGGGGGGGILTTGQSGATLLTGATGGSLAGGVGGTPGTNSSFGGAGGGTGNSATGAGGSSAYGGGGGGGGGAATAHGIGGDSIYGGAGGGGGGGSGSVAGGTAWVYGGNGGAGGLSDGPGTAGTAPGGGGGGGIGNTNVGGAGARGEVRVWVIGQ